VNQLYPKIFNLVIITITLLLFSLKGFGQNIMPLVNDTMKTLVASGEDAVGGSGSVTYSIGQVFYTYMGESIYNVSQGIQQGDLSHATLSSEENPVETKTEIIIFPNPTTDYININMQGYQSTNQQSSYQLYDLQGRLLKQDKVMQSETQINVTDLRAAIYLLQVYSDSKILKTFKIVKN
jgi:hypothetical protein